MELEEIRQKVDLALDKLYATDQFLIDNDLCEPSLNHRLAMYLQTLFPEHFVDCEYNRSHIGNDNDLKRVTNLERGNYIDIIVGKRDRNPDNDFICFETKKWSNGAHQADREKLQVLTSGGQFCYDYGFFIIYGRNRNDAQIEVYKEGRLI